MLQAYYGRARLGTIMGLCMGIMMVGMMLGPPLAGWIYDTSGSYQNAWITFMGVLVLGMILMLTTPSVEKYRSTVNR
jgi:MFS family permease